MLGSKEARGQRPATTPPSPLAIAEPERQRRLHAQMGRALVPPPGVVHLLGPDGEIPPWREQEVLSAWQSARHRAAARAQGADEELFFLTQTLGNQYVKAKDWARHRAMLESALDASSLPRHRSVIACDLCLGACRQGDAQGAASWLALADPASDDLYADSSYRLARARLATLTGDHDAVIATLGPSADELPIHDALEWAVAVQRADALEHQGLRDDAERELLAEMSKSPRARATVAILVRVYGLCPQSFPRAHERVARRSAERAAALVSGGIDTVFVPLGALLVLGGIIALGVAASGLLGVGATSSEQGSGSVIAGITLVPLGLLFYGLGKNARKHAEKARWLAIHGTPTRGAVLSLTPTGTSINDVPQMVVRVRVQREHGAPYEAQLTLLVPPDQAAQLTEGTTIALRVDPTNPKEIVADV